MNGTTIADGREKVRKKKNIINLLLVDAVVASTKSLVLTPKKSTLADSITLKRK